MKIAVDAMGGDFAPEQIVFGAVRAARKYQCEIVLVGDEAAIRSVLEREKGWEDLNITIHHASEVIGMGEHPADAVRTTRPVMSRTSTLRMVSDALTVSCSPTGFGAIIGDLSVLKSATPVSLP